MPLPYLIMAFLWKAAIKIVDKLLKDLLEEEDSDNNRAISLAIMIVIVTCFLAACVIAKISTLSEGFKDLRAEVREVKAEVREIKEDYKGLRAEIRTLNYDMIRTGQMAERCKVL